MKDGARRRCDLVIAEDSSRLYRNESACFDLVGEAVDEDIRVICVNDFVDTAEEDWEDKLREAQHHHSRSNTYTSRRIKRAHEGLWAMGAALGLVNPGYRRKATIPATGREPERGPFFDEIDHQHAPAVAQAFEMLAEDESPAKVAEHLNRHSVPKCANAKKASGPTRTSSRWLATRSIAVWSGIA